MNILKKINNLNYLPKIKNIIIICIIIIFFTLIIVLNLNYECPFKKITGLSCPGCGLTRSIKSLLNFNILESLKYNILGIPIFLLSIISIIFLLIDVFKNREVFILFVFKLFSKYYILILFLIILSMFLGNLNNI